MKQTLSKPLHVTAVLSLLHEPTDRPNSATRRFRGEAPLAWALYRLRRSRHLFEAAILCWNEQLPQVQPIADEMKIQCFAWADRTPMATLDAVAASRRWADGWRGGLAGACEFDRGFHAGWTAQIAQTLGADAVVLVDPSSSLVDAALIDALIENAESQPKLDLIFSQAAPGLSGVLLKASLVSQLAATGGYPGRLLGYQPDLPVREPISTPACVAIPARLARTTQRFTLDSERQIDRISNATVHLNGQLIATEAEQLVESLSASPELARIPREVVLELTARRSSRPIYWPGTHLALDRADLPLETAKQVIDELANVDDVRLLIAGAGDPVLHANLGEIIDHAHAAGISAIAIETDLLGIGGGDIDRLADSPLDVISVFLPAATAATYQAVMGIDAMKQAMENLKRLIERREARRHGTPLVVPTFVKTSQNLGEMEAWYDHWLRVLACAVITGPADFGRQIVDVSVGGMEPQVRHSCARLAKRITILSDGRIVSCEQDVLGKQALGTIGRDSIKDVWSGSASAMRADHMAGNWNKHAVCAACREWHRP